MIDIDHVHGSVSPVFDARRLVVKREPTPLLVGAEVHRGTMLRRCDHVVIDYRTIAVASHHM